jgi:hypothetical protein
VENARGQTPSKLTKGANLSGLLDVKRLTVSSNLRVEDCKFIPRSAAQPVMAIGQSSPKADPWASRMERDDQAYAHACLFCRHQDFNDPDHRLPLLRSITIVYSLNT